MWVGKLETRNVEVGWQDLYPQRRVWLATFRQSETGVPFSRQARQRKKGRIEKTVNENITSAGETRSAEKGCRVATHRAGACAQPIGWQS